MSIDTMMVMPNHIHAILQLKGSQLTLGEVVRRIKSRVFDDLGVNAWQSNYYEHVIRNDESLSMIREYVTRNPELEVLKVDKRFTA